MKLVQGCQTKGRGYDFNSACLEVCQKPGMRATGLNPQGKLVEIVEVNGHPGFVGVVPPRVAQHGGQAAPALHRVRESGQ
jgi:CTP synthase (UTP-ammonia lyase)